MTARWTPIIDIARQKLGQTNIPVKGSESQQHDHRDTCGHGNEPDSSTERRGQGRRAPFDPADSRSRRVGHRLPSVSHPRRQRLQPRDVSLATSPRRGRHDLAGRCVCPSPSGSSLRFSGQSNEVGIGQVGPAGMTHYDKLIVEHPFSLVPTISADWCGPGCGSRRPGRRSR